MLRVKKTCQNAFIEDSARKFVVKAPKSCHITPFVRSLHWLRINERIEYKLYKVFTITQPPYLYNLMFVQFPRSTPSSSVVTLARPLTSFSLKITARSFRYASPCLWNQLPLSLRQFHSGASSSISDSPIPSPVTSSSSVSPLCSPITLSLSPVFVSLFVYPGDIWTTDAARITTLDRAVPRWLLETYLFWS